jgi:hypothetical protein
LIVGPTYHDSLQLNETHRPNPSTPLSCFDNILFVLFAIIAFQTVVMNTRLEAIHEANDHFALAFGNVDTFVVEITAPVPCGA